jgi:predicted RNA-binding Zn-ribbon protein involved in translation (DUF1610 family)
VNQRNFKSIAINFSGIGFWLVTLAIILLLSSLGLGWLLKSIFVVLLILFLTPVIALIALRWWLKRNVIEDQCPSCEVSFLVVNNTQGQCPNCGERVTVKDRKFVRYSPPGTIDVDVVEVSSKDTTSSPKELNGQ